MNQPIRSDSQLGALVSRACWIGRVDAGETKHLWGWCKRRLAATQRDSLTELAAYPVPGLRHAIIARTCRAPLDADAWCAAACLHPLARWATLSGRLCEGEGRTGEPWKGFARLRVCEGIPGIRTWLAEPVPPASGAFPSSLLVGLVATQYRLVEHVEEFIRSLGGFAVWSRPGEYARLLGVSALIIDDSALPELVPPPPLDPQRADVRHELLARCPDRVAVLASLPEETETQRWRSIGVDTVFPKPLRIEHLSQWLRRGR